MKTQTPLFLLPEGTRIKLIKMDAIDLRFDRREDFEGKIYTAVKSDEYFSTAFIMDGDEEKHKYVHAGYPEYKIVKSK